MQRTRLFTAVALALSFAACAPGGDSPTAVIEPAPARFDDAPPPPPPPPPPSGGAGTQDGGNAFGSGT